MILVYSPQITPRIRYIFKLIINDLLKDEVEFTPGKEEYAAYEGPKINYSAEYMNEGLFFEAQGLLSQKEIENIELVFVEGNDPIAFFPAANSKSVMNFDPFAASFYLVTRYEEYLPFVRDDYGRFQAKESIAAKSGFLDKPVVNLWANIIGEKISKKWPAWKPGSKEYRFIPTIDMNAAWKYKHKGFFRTSAGLISSLGKGKLKDAADRIKVVLGQMEDPFNTFSDQLGIHRDNELQTIYFILFAEYDTNDRNIPVSNRHFQVLIKSLADYCRIGIHTSFASLKSQEKLDQEFSSLAAVINKDISMSRQHFHVLNMPLTYRNFVNRDVEDDYSMGYAVTPGFRAGICDPFNFYDLDFEVETNMKIWPFALVDKALENGYSMEKNFKPIIKQVKAVNGTLISLWNNESLVKDTSSVLNLAVYEKMIMMARS